ncbi:MAG: DMT family transporter [Bacteroidales bacterium]|nr:DMT family transporter [Bacteroidales bacterium]
MGKTGKLLIYTCTLVAVSLWGLSYIWCDRLIELEIPVEFFLPARILMAGLILLAVNLVCGFSIRIRKEDLTTFLLLALCEPFIYFFCETYGIKLTGSPTISALVIATTPVVAVFAGLLFFKEKVTWLNILGILVCLGGLLLVSHARSTTGRFFVLGILVLLIAVFAEVGHASCTKSLTSGYAPSVVVMYQFLIGAVYFIPFFLTRGLETYDPELYLSWPVWRPILALSILCSSLAFSLMAFSIKHLGVAKSSIFLAMIPVATALWGFLLGDEILCRAQWIGLAIACAGLILTQWNGKKDAA